MRFEFKNDCSYRVVCSCTFLCGLRSLAFLKSQTPNRNINVRFLSLALARLRLLACSLARLKLPDCSFVTRLLLARKIQNPGRNDAKYRLSSVWIPQFWHVESDICIEVKKDTVLSTPLYRLLRVAYLNNVYGSLLCSSDVSMCWNFPAY